MDWAKTIGKGVKDFVITTVAAVGGLIGEFAIQAVAGYFTDPAHVAKALEGFPHGIAIALTPLISGAAYSGLNWVKHRHKDNPPPEQAQKQQP